MKLADKKVSKATNSQVIELTPAMVLEPGKSFKRGYRNVIVVKKMTFPNDKVLTIEMTEKQISGRNISLPPIRLTNRYWRRNDVNEELRVTN